MIQDLRNEELSHFGRRYTIRDNELKGKKLLKRKTFRLAKQLPSIPEEERTRLAKSCLEDGANAGKKEITGLSQAKLTYVKKALDLAREYDCKAFASIIEKSSPRPAKRYLRKDYAYLFERFFYYLEDKGTKEMGVVVFDELEKARSHILLNQMESYFKYTDKGKNRSRQIIPEPFFVHSDLTTGIQLADLIAYIISWGVRFGEMKEPKRNELNEYATKVEAMRYDTIRKIEDMKYDAMIDRYSKLEFNIWGFVLISDLRPSNEIEM